MRLWSLHPQYLDAKGLVALWREGLLAQKVLMGNTRGYTQHPQLLRFRTAADPTGLIGAYLSEVVAEACKRGYCFDDTKIVRAVAEAALPVNQGQLAYEWAHLQAKLQMRSPLVYEKWRGVHVPRAHPLFAPVPGGVEDWERIQ